MIALIIVMAMLAASLTYFIIYKLQKGPVIASAIVTLVSGIVLPQFFPDKGLLLATVATAGSYAAMVSKEKFPRILDIAFVGALCGIVFLLTEDVFVGVGGRLGSIAAISCFTWLGIKKIKNLFIK
ncbi:MAG: hypothetical protein GX080_02040 [Tissierellia bacterium]|nr:hypothetical protein [Tissierellia bacterium]